jgi:tripartite-type tricarboxylate transporter receptor subunit TctC
MSEQLINRRHFLAAGMGGGISLAAASPLLGAQTLDRNARLLVGFPAGGAVDIVARQIAEHMKDFALSMIVENRVGAGGRLALDGLRRSEPDGTTSAITPGDQITLFPHVYKKLSYDPQRDFIPVTTVCTFPFVIVVGPMVPREVTTLADFAAWCRANPKLASFGSAGAGTRQHFLGTLFAREAKAEIAHVPFGGGAPALQAVLGGQIPAAITVLANAMSQVQGGSLRALATTAPERSALLPNLPTVREAGFGGMESLEWFGLFLPASTPNRIVDELTGVVKGTLAKPEVRAALAKQAFDISSISGDAFAGLIRTDTARWGRIVSDAAFTPLD